MFSRLKHVAILVIVTAATWPGRCQDTDKQSLNSIYKNLMNSADLEYLMQEYDKVCVRNESCTLNATSPSSLNFYDLHICPVCSCKDDCFLNDECCPDVLYGYMKFDCVNVIQSKGAEDIWFSIAYFMVSSCPENSTNAFTSTSNNSFDIPVTSLTSGLTYKTRHFADCNADNKSLAKWNMTVACPDDPFNYVEINSYEDLLENINNHNCMVFHSITNSKIPIPLSCKGKEYFEKKVFIQQRKLIENCNETGLWSHFDYDIDFACRQLQLPYLDYKNVFCFICNPGLSFKYHETKPVISTCNMFDETDSLNSEAEKACLTRNKTPYHLPFKNLHCKLCNIQRAYFDVATDELYTTYINVRGIQAKTVAETVGNYFLMGTNSNAYIETNLDLDINFNDTDYNCSIPVRLPNSSFCNGEDLSCTENYVCQQYLSNNCTDKFRNYVVRRDTHLDSYYETNYSEQLLYNYVFEMYLCDESVSGSILCDAITEKNECLESESRWNDKLNPSKRALSCLVCQKSTFDYSQNFIVNTEFEILIKITCPNLLEPWFYIDIQSLLEVARTCTVTFFPSGIYNAEYARVFDIQDSCLDFPFIDSLTCRNAQGSFFFGSYRKLFSLPGDNLNSLLHVQRRLPTSTDVCAEYADPTESQTNETCREIQCSDGHILDNGTCVSKYETYANALYNITYRFAISSPDCGGKVTTSTPDVCHHIKKMVENKVGNKTSISFQECSVFANTECSEEVVIENAISSDLKISFTVMVDFTTELTTVERAFVDSLTKRVDYKIRNDSKCTIKLKPSNNKMIQTSIQLCYSFVYNRHASTVFKMTSVSKFLTCPLIELMEEEFVIDNISDALTLKDGGRIVEYYTIIDGRFRICLDDWNIQVQSTYEVTGLQRIYKLVDNICTILSLFCLSLTFITYTILRPLQTVPGVNNMSLTFSLFFAQLTLKLGIWQPTDSILCPIFGVFIHFFWMATFCSMNVCCYHINRVFNDFVMSQSTFTVKTKVQYLLYTYLLPAAVIILTACIHLGFSYGSSFGYGETICFLTDTISVIVAFLVPCVVVFLSNILFFGKTILFIRRTRGNSYIRRSDDRRNLLIYLRLWTLLGVTWPLLIADAMLDLTVFSFIALSFNTLQGVFIFMSFVCNKRVLSMYRQMLSGTNKNTKLAN